MTTTSAARGLSKRDWTAVVCGTLVLVASFLPWEAASAAGYTASDSAWNAGFGAWFGSLLCAAAAGAVAARHLGYAAGLRGIGPNLATCALAAAGAALLVIRLLTLPRGGSGFGLPGTPAGGYGPGFGAFAGAGLAVVQAIVAGASLRASGERLPSAAAARPRAPASPPTWPPAPAPDDAADAAPGHPGSRLARLDQLRNGGLISPQEYAEQRRRILSQL
jgi:hypothetical protein